MTDFLFKKDQFFTIEKKFHPKRTYSKNNKKLTDFFKNWNFFNLILNFLIVFILLFSDKKSVLFNWNEFFITETRI